MGFASLFGFGTQQRPLGGTVSHQSFFERMGNAIFGVCIGVFLFLGGIGIIGWNEGRSVHTSCAIFEAGKVVQEATCEKSVGLDNSLVHVACPIDKEKSRANFYFVPFDISASGLVFSGSMQQYQIIEQKSCTTTKDSTGGGSTETCIYSYDLGWLSSRAATFQSLPQDRNQYDIPSWKGYNAPFPDAISSKVPSKQTSPKTYLGEGYFLTPGNMVSAATAPAITASSSTSLPPFYDSNFWQPNYGPSGSGDYPDDIIVVKGGNSNFRYVGGSYVTYPSSPRVGDVKISFSVADAVDNFSVLAQQLPAGNFESYVFDKCSGYGMYQYQAGISSASSLLAKATSENTALTWILRVMCFFFLWFGLQLCFGPCVLMPDIIPCIGPYISDLVGALLCCATCILASFWFCLVVSLSWIYFRPIIGIPLFCAAVVLAGGLTYWRCKNKNKDFGQGGDMGDEGGTGEYAYQPQQPEPQQAYQQPYGQPQQQQAPPFQQPYGQPQQQYQQPPQQQPPAGYPPPGGYPPPQQQQHGQGY